MPISSAPHVRRPYVRPVYESEGLVRLADLGREQGHLRARGERERGDRAQQSWQHIGQAIAAGLGSIRQERELIPLREAAARKMAYEEEQIRRGEQAYGEGQRAKQGQAQKAERLRALVSEYQGQPIPTDVLIREFGPADAAGIAKDFAALYPKTEQEKPVVVGGRLVTPSTGSVVYEPPAEPKPPKLHPVTVPGPNGRPMTKMFTEEQLQGGVETYRAPTASTQQPPDTRAMIRKGAIVWVPKGQEQAGDVPYSADAMQGMGGESSDARSQRTAAALNGIETLKSLAPKRLDGPVGMVQGAYESVKGAAGYNTGVRQYNALLGPTAMQMAVAIQGAAGLSNRETEVMAGMLGNIGTMDYQSQMALLEKASEMVRSGADVDYADTVDPKTKQTVKRWVPRRSRAPGLMPGQTVTVGGGLNAVPPTKKNPF